MRSETLQVVGEIENGKAPAARVEAMIGDDEQIDLVTASPSCADHESDDFAKILFLKFKCGKYLRPTIFTFGY